MGKPCFCKEDRITDITALLVDLFVIYAAARISAELFERLGQPAVIGELLAGLVIGPYGLGLLGNVDAGLLESFHDDLAAAKEAQRLVYHLLAELGVVVLLFFVGLEMRIDEILQVGGRALLVGVLGILIPLALGYGLMYVLGYSGIEALFIGTALVATSVGVTARVLRDLGAIATVEARIVLGAAVIDDILALMLLSVVTGVASTGSVRLLDIGLVVVQAVAFTVFVVLIGVGAMRRFDLHLEKLRMENPPLSVALLTMLGLAALAGTVGLAGIIGAFLAGIVFAEARQQPQLHEQTLRIYQFLVPFFFVITGSQVDWRVFLDSGLLGLALGLTVLAILGKLIGGGLPVHRLGLRSMAIVGTGMVPRGEVGLIVASLGLSLGVIPETLFSVVVIMSILTTVVTPPVLRRLFVSEK